MPPENDGHEIIAGFRRFLTRNVKPEMIRLLGGPMPSDHTALLLDALDDAGAICRCNHIASTHRADGSCPMACGCKHLAIDRLIGPMRRTSSILATADAQS